MATTIGAKDDVEAIDKTLSIDQINSMLQELQETKTQMKQLTLELKIKDQENVILSQQIKNGQLKSTIGGTCAKKEQLI